MAFLNAKDVAYDRPGSVAGYYGWNPGNIDDIIASRAMGDGENALNVRSSMDKYLGKRGATLDGSSPRQRISALDYAYREEGRKQQTKGGGFLDFLKKAIGPAIGAVVLPGIGGALGASISAGVGGAIGGAIQGGVEDGLGGAALGALGGYGIGSGIGSIKNFAGNALSGGGFANPSALGYQGTDLALPGLSNATGATTAAGIGNPAGVIGNALSTAAQGIPAGMGGWASSLYQPQSMGGPAAGGNRIQTLARGADIAGGLAGMMGQQQTQGPAAAPNEAPGVSLGGTAEAPRPSLGGSPAQTPTFDATLLSAAGKMPSNALAMTGMGSGGVGLTERDMRRNPGYQPRPVANFLMV